MGKHLQIRVSAATFRPEDIKKAWPALHAIAWPDPPPADTPAGPLFATRGVLELVEALDNGRRFHSWPKELVELTRDGIDTCLALKDRLEQALADWKPAEANTLSDELEERLAELDKSVPREFYVEGK